ncbi:MAG: tetratricopeptide repeat protein, partial [Woeseiaceae bacterium]
AAEASLRRALELDPSVTNAYNWLAGVLAMQNRRDEGLAVRQKGLGIDPLNPIMTINVAGYHQDLGEFSKAETLLRRLLELPSPPELAYLTLFGLYSDFGQFADAMRVLVEWQATGPASADPELFYELAEVCLALGLHEYADTWYQRGVDGDFLSKRILLRKARMLKAYGKFDELRAHMKFIDTNDPIETATMPIPALDTLATVRIFAGQYPEGISVANDLLDVDDLRPEDGVVSADAVNLLHALAFAYQATGDSRQAADTLLLAAAFIDLRLEKGGSENPAWLEQQMLNLTMRGNLDDAAATLARAVDAGWRNYRLLAHDPRWLALFDMAEVEPSLAAIEDDLDRQAAEVESILADLGL